MKYKTSKTGDEKLLKPMTAEYIGCFLVLIPLFIFLIFAVMYLLMRHYGYLSGWEMLKDFWHYIVN